MLSVLLGIALRKETEETQSLDKDINIREFD